MYRIPYYSFVRPAREAEAHYCLRKTAILDVDMIEKYLAEHSDVADRVQSVRAAESSEEGVSIFRHDPDGKVAAAYMDFGKELMSHEKTETR